MGRLFHLFDLEGRTAVVTGGNSGIGLEIARALGLQGASVILVGRNAENLDTAKASLRNDAIEVADIVADLADASHIESLLAKLGQERSGVDILINAAGVNLRQPFSQVKAQDFDLHMALHLRAPFLLTQGLAPGMQQRGWGRIINIASLQSSRAFPNSAPYGAAKGGIVQLTRAIAEEWSRYGITCNAIAPGFFPTPLTEPVFSDPKRAAANAAQTAIGRNGNLDDLYGTAIFLASDASAYLTGQTIHVDGGFTAK
ncbi:SDR family NAD(P)-dependent oxidoreductase [Brucella thiophenivorans]|uniref:NADH(P)-binding family protein n=1 Tax=Brucella thiophenivorans TaxID=571255 RepID=A0A256G779_9HYPH|nr:SDR family oxidoreductase [Brucella thiophenivorans]OYR22995.1 NADH(P)-binding family protein [Brucella thiophenivorans]